MFKYLITQRDVDMRNPVEKVKLHDLQYDPEIIPTEEFEKFLTYVTYDNGWGTRGTKGDRLNHYRPWLKKVFMLELLTGERLDGLVLLK